MKTAYIKRIKVSVFIVLIVSLLIISGFWHPSQKRTLQVNKLNFDSLFITSYNPLHQKNVPRMSNYKISSKKDINILYGLILQGKSETIKDGKVVCPNDSGVYYKLKFQSPNTLKDVWVRPTGCSGITILNGQDNIHLGPLPQDFWDILAKELEVTPKNLSGFGNS